MSARMTFFKNYFKREAAEFNNPPEGPLAQGSARSQSAEQSVGLRIMVDNTRSTPNVPSSIDNHTSLESLPLNRVLKYHLPRQQQDGKWYRAHYRFTFKESIKSLRKKLFWKTIFSRISAAEFLVLDHLVQQSWRESRLAGTLEMEVLVLQSLGIEQRVLTQRNWNQLLSPFRPSARLISLCSEMSGLEDEEKIKQYLKRKLKLPDRVQPEDYLIKFQLVKTVSPTPPPKPVIGVGYDDHGSMKKDHELGFEIVNGMQDTENFDQVVLQILSSKSE